MAPWIKTLLLSSVHLSVVCDALAASEVEYSQHTVQQSAALIPAADRHIRPTLKEMTRKLMAMQWFLADTFPIQTLVGLWWSDTAVTLGVWVADNLGGWLPAGHNHCCMNLVLYNHTTPQAHMNCPRTHTTTTTTTTTLV